MGHNPIFLTSGYKGKISKPCIANNDVILFGDEAIILKNVGPTGVSKKKQKELSKAIKRARFLSLISYTNKSYSQ